MFSGGGYIERMSGEISSRGGRLAGQKADASRERTKLITTSSFRRRRAKHEPLLRRWKGGEKGEERDHGGLVRHCWARAPRYISARVGE